MKTQPHGDAITRALDESVRDRENQLPPVQGDGPPVGRPATTHISAVLRLPGRLRRVIVEPLHSQQSRLRVLDPEEGTCRGRLVLAEQLDRIMRTRRTEIVP